MKETFEFRINYDYANLLFEANEGKDLGQLMKTVKVVNITKDDPRFFKIPEIDKQVNEKYGKRFFIGWAIQKRYTKKELNTAKLLHLIISAEFEPAGEECGTLYDEKVACEICGANRKQRSPLTLKSGSVPKKDIARTIAGEIVVSEKYVAAFKQRGLKGALFEPIVFNKGPSNYYQLIASTKIELSQSTIAGINPFDLSNSSEGEIYKCPKGHTIGLNLLSEVYVLDNPVITENDFIESKQEIGVIRGLLRPRPLYLCSSAFREMVEEEKLSGFEFEIAHIQ